MSQNIWEEYVDRIAGGWKCVSFHVVRGAGSDRTVVDKPHGDEPLGRMLISRKGYLSALVANPRTLKPLASGKSWQDADDAEVAQVAKGQSMYCGYLKLFKDEQGLYWRTAVEVASDSNRMGSVEERRVELSHENGEQFLTLEPTRDLIMEASRIVLAA